MNVLLLGSGGREHSIAIKLSESKKLTKLFIASGNAGTEQCGVNVNISPVDIEAVCKFAIENYIDFVVVGPELPLSLGVVDSLYEAAKKNNRSILCFGPSKATARIESSKVFSKQLMTELKIPTAKYQIFSSFKEAASEIKKINYPFVIKASGLASGKGVFLPNNSDEAIGILYNLFEQKTLGAAANEVIIEEKLYGDEVSVMAFCDGHDISVMPSAQDHKRLLDNDEGPNTGGMGAYSPAIEYKQTEEFAQAFILPVIKKFKHDGTPFVGVLYAGLILTADGPKVLEYNARFGDPETQAVLPLFTGDLLETMLACAKGQLKQAADKIKWSDSCSVAVVLASASYPSYNGDKLLLPASEMNNSSNTFVIHAGTENKNGFYSNGGRILSVTGVADTIAKASTLAYDKIKKIHIDGTQYRTDIAKKAMNKKHGVSAYSQSGVDIDAGNKAVALMAEAVKSTYTKNVLSELGSFGGLFDLADVLKMNKPVLVGSTDGVGTKVKIAAQAGSYKSIGMDIVNHCIDDILVQGAKPLFFLDYFASSKLDPSQVAEIVSGMSIACKNAGCALIGGETAEMPDVYMKNEFDIAGTIVGVVETEKILPKKNIQEGDLLIGLASDSPHTNGYSLIRKVFKDVPLNTVYPELGERLDKVLLKPHRSYLQALYPILQNQSHIIKALAHITGGGFVENIPRVLPKGFAAKINKQTWKVPPLYNLIQKKSNIAEAEMYRVFNMGIAMIAIVEAKYKDEFSSLVKQNSNEDVFVIGKIISAKDNNAKPYTIIE